MIRMTYTIAGQSAEVTLDDDKSPDIAWRFLAAFIARAEGREDYKEVGKQAEEEARAARINSQRKRAQKEQGNG
jgi:hypothetical protein